MVLPGVVVLTIGTVLVRMSCRPESIFIVTIVHLVNDRPSQGQGTK